MTGVVSCVTVPDPKLSENLGYFFCIAWFSSRVPIPRDFSSYESSFIFLQKQFLDEVFRPRGIAHVGVPRTRGCLGHHEVEHVKVGAVDGPSEAVVKTGTCASIV